MKLECKIQLKYFSSLVFGDFISFRISLEFFPPELYVVLVNPAGFFTFISTLLLFNPNHFKVYMMFLLLEMKAQRGFFFSFLL